MKPNQTRAKDHSMMLRKSSVIMVIAILFTILGLMINPAYANNPQISPLLSDRPAITAATVLFGDDTAADFSQGNLSGCTYVSETSGGELILSPTIGTEFGGSTIPAGWIDTPWIYQPGGSSVVSGGSASIDESLLATTTYYAFGHVLDFVATFQPDVNQHAGFAVDLDASANWAVFSTGSPGGSIIKARTSVNGTPTETDTSFAAGGPHHFRIVWTSTQVIYYIDDMASAVATHDADFTEQLRPAFSDLTPGPPPDPDHTKKLVVDWAHMSPYASPCTFTSRIFDAGAAANWQTLTWTAGVPAGTNLAFSYQVGATATPDSTWSSFIDVPTSGAAITGRGRYARYRVTLSTSNPDVTPDVQQVQFTTTTDADATAPIIVSRSPGVGETNVPVNTDITVTFSELLNPATVNGTSVYLQEFGSSTHLPANVSLSAGNVITLHPTAPFVWGTQYTVTIASSVADLANNPMIADPVWSFTTTNAITDTTLADFQGGSGCYLADTTGGEVMLLPAAGAEFSGSTLPIDWAESPWSAGGSVVVADGIANVENSFLYYSGAAFAPGHSLQFVATFTASTDQHIGLSNGSDFATYAFFSTSSTTTDLFSRTSDGMFTQIAGSYVGSSHLYRIDWTASAVTFSVDGAQVAQHDTAIAGNMIPFASDNTLNGQPAKVDWMRMTPYASPCTFTSRVFDAGKLFTWDSISWVGSSTGLALSYRAGNTNPPDGTWTDFTAAPASPTTLNIDSRYIQYRVVLSTADPEITPVLESVTFTGSSANFAPVITQGPATSVTMSEDGSPTAFSLTLNATDVNLSDTLTWSISTQATNGTAGASGTGNSKAITYAPASNYSGPDSFVVQVSDGNGGIDTITVNVTVTPVNDAPAITEGASTSVSMSEDGIPTAFSLTLNATDVDPADTLTWSISTPAANGTAGASGTGTSKIITYTPTANYFGADSFVVQVSDGNGGTDTITVNVTVTAVNDAPVITEGASVNVVMSINGVPNAFSLTLNATDVDLGDTLTWSIATPAANGTAAASGTGSSMAIGYTPNPDYVGSDSFIVQVADGNGGTDTITVNVTISSVSYTSFLPLIMGN